MFDNVTYKIGGSILTDDTDYETVARFLIEETSDKPGPVPVVVSAREGETDRLLAEAAVIFPDDPWRQVQFAALEGDFLSAAKFAHALNVLGAKTAMRSPWDLKIEASGDDPFCGRLIGLNHEAFAQELIGAESRFVVIPGYVGIHVSEQRGGCEALVALGRGGSDLIGVEVARYRGGALRLIKSAECIYAVSPDFVDSPKSVTHMTPEQALRVLEYMRPDDQFIQARAVQHAKQHNVVIEFGSMAAQGVYSRIDSSYQTDEHTLFRALPIRDDVSRLAMTVDRSRPDHFFATLVSEGITFSDGGTVLSTSGMKAVLFVERSKVERAMAVAGELTENLSRRDGALFTLIDTSIEPEGQHFLRVYRALAGIPIIDSRSSGIILHLFLEKEDTRKAARALAEEFDLLQRPA